MKWRVLANGIFWGGTEKREFTIIEADRAVVEAATLCFLDRDSVLLEAFAPANWANVQRQEEKEKTSTNCSAKDDTRAT